MKVSKSVLFLVLAACLALPASAFSKPVTINWWHAMRSARGEVVAKMINDFKRFPVRL